MKKCLCLCLRPIGFLLGRSLRQQILSKNALKDTQRHRINMPKIVAAPSSGRYCHNSPDEEAVPPPLMPTSTNEVRVLLDTGLSDDLIFTKKGSGGEDDVTAEDGVNTTTTTTNNIIHAAERATPKKSHNRTGKKATADVEYPNILHSSYQTYMNGGRNAQLPRLHGNSFKWSKGISGSGEVWCLACNYRLVEVSYGF